MLKKLRKLNDKYTITIRIPNWLTGIVVLIIMAATGKVGATISMFMLAFVFFIFLVPDDF